MKDKRLPPLGSLKAFDAVARLGSFKRAADEIGVTPTAISHQIRVLEESLETAVLLRSAREVTLTSAGTRLQQATQRAFASLQDAVNDIYRSQLPPALTLTTTSNFLTHWLVPRLTHLRASVPALDLRLHTSVELVDLSKNTVDVAIRYSMEADDQLESTLLHEDTFVLVASPSLGITRLEQLNQVTLFHVENRHIPLPSPDWPQWRDRYGPASLNIDAGLSFTDETHAIQAAIAGQGVAIVSSLLAKDFIEKNILTVPFDHALAGGKYYFVTTREKAAREDICALKGWMQAQLSAAN
ncbi:LysR family transcriptional regulator [Rouxiella badensis]|jgi:LysR family glycine cleavage system transcriptional activator|uniref:LysR substrate-binding domain-containing protein n=1 Tax=Rouxiella badensis TaxID=1646377 RepID=UPI0013EEFC03|nr:LysR substrate-binding domain-containing protein [Rouxiella badensis]MCC3721053.1 LysR family transcriptional regulator [Rouxiella badensis]MCC3730856.1 LysR family transcriptional regulator [Rouxiella badensis]QII37560.1 LysR family transcriptional regulator [Rouxiella badensis]